MATWPLSNLLDGTKFLWTKVQGIVADSATVSGNPVLIGGKYSATPATRHDGDAVTLETDANGNLKTVLSGSKMELYGATINDRPAANTVAKGATFTIVDKNLDQNWVSDGTDWLEV